MVLSRKSSDVLFVSVFTVFCWVRAKLPRNAWATETDQKSKRFAPNRARDRLARDERPQHDRQRFGPFRLRRYTDNEVIDHVRRRSMRVFGHRVVPRPEGAVPQAAREYFTWE